MSSTLTSRLESTVRRWLLHQMSASEFPSIEELDLKDLLIVYGNWRARFVDSRPRRVHVSQELTAELEDSDCGASVKLISDKIRVGTDVTPHLSRAVRVVHPDEGQDDRNQGDLDPMLAEWGVHHLHLGSDLRGDGFVSRTGRLLFAGFTPTDAYLIGLYSHGSWALRDVVERLARNWDGAGILMRSEYAIGVTHTFDSEDHAALREAGMNVGFEVDGRVYSPPGQTLAGTPGRVTHAVNGLCWALHDWSGREGERLPAFVGGEPAYWLPALRDGRCGFACREEFVEVGLMPGDFGGR